MVPSLELSIVVWSRYIALKLFWRIWKNDAKKGPPFHTFLQLFCNNFKTLVLSYNLPHFLPIFKKTDENPDIRSILFQCNKELHKKFAPILIVCQRWNHSQKTKTSIIFDLDVILTCGFFLKSHFLNLHGTAFLFFIFLNERSIETSFLMTQLKCTVVHYPNLNSGSVNKPFLNYRPLNMLFRFFRFLIYVYFNKAFVKNSTLLYLLLIQISKIHFRM